MFALTKSELRQVLAAVDLASPFGRRDALLISFTYHTALRVGECSGLVVHLVALDGQPRQYLHLPATICKGSRGRVVPLNAKAQACVRQLLAFNSARGLAIVPSRAFQNRRHGSFEGERQAAAGGHVGIGRARCAGCFAHRRRRPLTWWTPSSRGHGRRVLG